MTLKCAFLLTVFAQRRRLRRVQPIHLCSYNLPANNSFFKRDRHCLNPVYGIEFSHNIIAMKIYRSLADIKYHRHFKWRLSELLRDKYKRTANEADAETNYQMGLRLLNDSQFQDAASAFDKAQSFVPGYKDSAKLTEKAKNAMPSKEQLNSAIGRALGSKIPVSWVGNLMGGRLRSLDDLQVVRIGIYNQDKKYWPMKIRCVGTAALKDPFNQGKQSSFNKVGDILLYRDDYGDWQASMRGGMFQ